MRRIFRYYLTLVWAAVLLALIGHVQAAEPEMEQPQTSAPETAGEDATQGENDNKNEPKLDVFASSFAAVYQDGAANRTLYSEYPLQGFA